MLEQYKPRPRDEAMETIESYIIEHSLQPGDRLPSERDLCEQYGFNRTTLRSAIRKLIDDGKLYSRLGSGTFVARPKLLRNLQDVQRMTDVAQQGGRTLKTRVLSREVIEANKQIAQTLKVPLGHKVFFLYRLRLMDDEPVLLEMSYVDYRKCAGIEERDLNDASLYAVLEEYGLTVDHGQETIGITYTTDDEAELLNLPREHPVFFIRGVGNGGDGEPIEFFKSLVRSDLIRFTSTLTR